MVVQTPRSVPGISRAVLSTVLLLAAAAPGHTQDLPPCDDDNAGLVLPEGFCALVVADQVGRARHLTVSDNGDVIVALSGSRASDGGIVVLRDTTGDGRADIESRFASGSGNGIALRDGYLYYAINEAVVRYPWRLGALEPAGPADTIVSGLPAESSHRAKSIAFDDDGWLYVNIGSPSNACQEQRRTAGSPGKDPCDELETRAGIWRFDANRTGQTQADGERFATGLRNTVALAFRPQDGQLYGVVHGRDQLSTLWPEYYTDYANAEKPAEEFVRIEQGSDFGWPYCYYDAQLERKVLAPEYGGDGQRVRRCRDMDDPLIAFPAHWAPNGLVFYQGTQFPQAFRGGAFIAFHGSWNRAPLPQEGYNVALARFDEQGPTGRWTVFARGFAGEIMGPREAEHRPVGVAEGPDGSLYVSDDSGGRIYRILFARAGR